LQNLGNDKAVLIRAPLDKAKKSEEQASDLKAKISNIVTGKIEYRKTDYVGPQVGGELIHTAITALLLSFAAMFTYMWFRFEWQYGAGALLALVHDAIATLGFYSISGIEFNITSVAAILTIVGYSINDSVVIYDRLRENIRKHRKKSLAEIIDLSVNETLSRTILTVGTTLLSVIALALFGGEVLKSFSLGMLVGVVVGTYSSIYISAILLIYLDPRRPEGKETETA
jgi:preprotein translocase SecF subunit